ncbi:MAG: S9 family peptidase [candidate division Zixibacteria bacterium]|nr:S9 family peptidase [candidate division Zixibacteria bacterium]
MRILNKTNLLLVSLLILAFGLSGCGGGPSTDSSLIPIDTLFGIGDKISPLMSPDCEHIAYLALADGVMNVHLTETGADNNQPLTDDSLYGIRKFVWAADSRHILYLQDKLGNGNLRLYDVDISNGEHRDLTPFDHIRVQIITINKKFPNKVLFAMNKDNPRAYNVYELDLISGNFDLVAENPGTIIGWLANSQMKVYGCVKLNKSGRYEFMVVDPAAGGWKKIIEWNQEDMQDSSPIGFSKDSKTAYILDSRDANTGRLLEVNIESGDTKVIAEDPVFNVNGVIIHPETFEIQAVTFARQREETIVLDESIRDDIETIKKLHQGDYFISSRSADDKKWLIGFKNDVGSVPFYIYDRDTRKAEFQFYHYPELNDHKLAPMEPVTFTSRDSMLLYGYMTYPTGGNRKNLPVIIYVHDGPWSRDSWRFHPEVQWLANRGFACFQINYRGSTGYGKKYRQAGIRQWGKAMQDDLADGAKWIIEQGIANPDQIAIMGTGYGGYAALMASAKQSDLFACAIDISGYTNLVSLMNVIPPQNLQLKQLYFNRVGNVNYEQDMLNSISPLTYADSMNIPMLIVQGKLDRQVRHDEVDKIVESLKARNIDHEYLVFDNEGHGISQAGNRMLYYQTAESFLNKHLRKQ